MDTLMTLLNVAPAAIIFTFVAGCAVIDAKS